MINSNFDEAAYLEANGDVAEALRNGKILSGLEHYRIHGIFEGRPLTTRPLSRKQKALYFLAEGGLGLEIGPSHNPIAPKRDGYNVHIIDHLTAEGLKEKYKGHEELGVNVDNIEEVDFVWSGEPLHELVNAQACYDWVVASHVIEHVPDLVAFMQQCERMLKPSGRLSLVIPDKRYCFDHFGVLTTTGDLLDSHLLGRTRPSPGKVFDYVSGSVKKGGKIAWGVEESGDYDLLHGNLHAKRMYDVARESGDYVDVHCWRFVLPSFSLIVDDLNGLGLTRLGIIGTFATVGCEFYVTLEVGGCEGLRCRSRLEYFNDMYRG